MKFSIDREKLGKALQRVGSIISSRSMLPILGNVLLKAEQNQLSLTTTDLEVRIETSVDAAVEVPGSTTVPVRRLSALVGRFTGSDIEVSVNDNYHMQMKCGSSDFTLLGISPEDFPTMTEIKPVREIKISELEFKRMLGAISYAVSPEDSRKVLTGVLLSTHDNFVTLVATDGKRLAVQEKNVEVVEGDDGDAIIPLKAANEIKRLLESDGTLTIRIGERQCVFETKNFTLRSKLIEGNYPNYRQVIPSSFTRNVKVNASQLLAKIETVSQVLSADSNAYVILSFGKNLLKLQGFSSDVGEGSDAVDIEYEGEPIDVSFNPEFLAAPLKYCDMEEITVKINDSFNPVAMEGGDGFLYVIMPIRKK